MKDYIKKIYKQFLTIYDLIITENIEIRKNSVMKDAPRNIRHSETSDLRIGKNSLTKYDTAKEMLQRFKADAKDIGSKLNQDYREWFFKENFKSSSRSSRRDRDFEPSSRSSRRHRDDDRDDRHGRGGRNDRDRDSRGGRDRGGRGDRDRGSRGDRDRRRSTDRYERNRSSRHERRSRR